MKLKIPSIVILDTQKADTVKQTLTLLGQAVGESERAENLQHF